MSTVLLLLAVLAQLDPSADLAPRGTVEAPDSAAVAWFDALVTARADVIVARADSVREVREASRPWWARWAPMTGLALLAIGVAGATAGVTYWVASRRLVTSDDAVARSTEAAKRAEKAAADAALEIRTLQNDVRASQKRADTAVSQAIETLQRTRDLLDRDDRTERFRRLFRETVRGNGPPDAP